MARIRPYSPTKERQRDRNTDGRTTKGRSNGRKNELTDVRMEGGMEGRSDESTERRMDGGRMDGRTEGERE